jgi:aryl-alcohol dehydrogenase-like predicted oxidoreductase
MPIRTVSSLQSKKCSVKSAERDIGWTVASGSKVNMSRIGLGTVQFGQEYGITNRAGRPAPGEVEAICRLASDAGVDTLDTAYLYGDSEWVIGGTTAAAAFRIVTKTPKFADVASAPEAADALLGALHTSLTRLGRQAVHALLLHDVDDLLGCHGEALWAAMVRARAQGLVGKIGVSVYHGHQIDAVLDRYPVEIVQLPLNPLDDRLVVGGQLERLAQARVEIHARSLFLQGLLLADPGAIEPRFGALREAVAELRDWASAQGLTPVEGVLALALTETRIDRFILGVTTARDLQEIVSAVECAQSMRRQINFVGSVALEPRHLDPSRWAELN